MNHQKYINSIKTLRTIKQYIIKHNLKKYECEECGIPGTWNDKKLVLHLHHLNGIHTDNTLNNLQFICPNCHSQTNSYCGAGKIKPFPPDNEVMDAIKLSYSIAGVLKNLNRKTSDANAYKKVRRIMEEYKIHLAPKPPKPRTIIGEKTKYVRKTKYPYPDIETMRKLVWKKSPYQLSKEWGIRDTTIRYWCQRRGIELPPVGYWRKKATGNL
jgi:hypothetical protein